MEYLPWAGLFLMVACGFAAIEKYFVLQIARMDLKTAKARFQEAEATAMQVKMQLEHCEAHRDED